ncbi:MAG: DUF2029 domain-containing protein, partial [Chloroflexi bacterium]|nr:DUF2029 domain-containing protein [Chloroflexota bacterium]
MLVALIAGKPGLPRTAALALLSLAALFTVALFGTQLSAPEYFGCMLSGEDFAAVYVSSRMVLVGEGAAVYDPTRRDEASIALREETHSKCAPRPAAYLLGFLLAFLPFTLLPPQPAYYLWTALSVMLFLFACWRLAKDASVSPWVLGLITLCSFPVVFGLLQGQLHSWQFFAFAEFWLALRQRSDRRAGLWLSLQLVKYYNLPLLLLFLVWQRRRRALSWFMAAGLFWLGLSIFLAGGVEG